MKAYLKSLHDFNSPRFSIALKRGDVVEFYDDEDPEDCVSVKRRVTNIHWSYYTEGCIVIECDEKVDNTNA